MKCPQLCSLRGAWLGWTVKLLCIIGHMDHFTVTLDDTDLRHGRIGTETEPATPVLAVPSAKLRPPAVLPGWIDRRALLKRLAAGCTHRLTLITAPAGYGKSTLAAQFVRGQGPSSTFQVIWLTLDTEDDDPAQFLTCLTAALAPLMPPLAALIASSLNQNRLQAALQSLLFGMEQMVLPLLVVLDDFHHIRSPAVQQLVAAAVERSPAACRWMVLTRHVPPARLIGKLRVQGELLEVNTDELRLSSAEIEALAARFKETQLDADAIDLLKQRTHGWIVGVHLALLALDRTAGSPARTVPALHSQLRGHSPLLAEYLTAQVLAQLPEALCLFLLQCSILDRLHWELCNAITAQDGSAALLEQARAEQLFIRALDAEGEWYELHQLFRDLLQHQLRLQCTPAQIQALHRRAADWFLKRNEIAQALHYLVVGGAPELAAALLINHARPALLHNRQAELRRWLSLLPNRTLDAHPQLLLDRAWLGVLSATDEFVAALADAEAALAGFSNLPAVWGDELAVLRLWRRMFSDDQRGIYPDALQTAERLAPESALARGWCWMVAVVACRTQPAGAPIAEHAAAAATAFAAAGYEIGTLVVIGWQAEYYAKLGDAQAALAACARAHQIIDAQQYPAFEEREFFDMLAGEVHYWSDHLDAAAACFQRALVDARMRGDALPILRARVCLQLCEMASGKTVTMTDAQREEETALWQHNVHAYASGYRSQVAFWRIYRWVRLGRPLDGWNLYQQMDVTLSTLPPDAHEAFWMMTLLVHVALGRELEGLTVHLERQLAQSEWNHRCVTAMQIRLIQVQQQQQLGHHNRARTLLRQTLHDIERTGYVRLLLDFPELLPAVRAIGTHYASTLVARMAAPAPSLSQVNLTAQELAILVQLVKGARIAEIAEILVISPATVKWHLTNLYAKLGVKNQQEAVASALRGGRIAAFS